MYSETLLDHFQNPRNAGEMREPTAQVELSNPVCGDVLRLAVRVADGRVQEARFLCRGCTASIACASLLTEKITGQDTGELGAITAESIATEIGGLPPASVHAAQLAAEALEAIVKMLSNVRDSGQGR
jgi:nitrogen fixation protein NifU and related proteins